GHTDRFQYGYDADSNVLFKKNLVNSALSELYHANGSSNGYDLVNRLTAFQRGTLNTTNDAISGSTSRTQNWTLDAQGNWTAFTATTNGSTTTNQRRTHNTQNQITSLTGATVTPTYDSNGNTKRDETNKTYVYDAWNRIVSTTVSSRSYPYSYDALGRRIVEGSSPGGFVGNLG